MTVTGDVTVMCVMKVSLIEYRVVHDGACMMVHNRCILYAVLFSVQLSPIGGLSDCENGAAEFTTL